MGFRHEYTCTELTRIVLPGQKESGAVIILSLGSRALHQKACRLLVPGQTCLYAPVKGTFRKGGGGRGGMGCSSGDGVGVGRRAIEGWVPMWHF